MELTLRGFKWANEGVLGQAGTGGCLGACARHCVVRLQQTCAHDSYLHWKLTIITGNSIAQHCSPQVAHRHEWVTACPRQGMMSRRCRWLQAESPAIQGVNRCPHLSGKGCQPMTNCSRCPQWQHLQDQQGSARLRSLLQVLDAGRDMTGFWRGTGTRPHHAGHSWETADQWWWLAWRPVHLQKQQTLFPTGCKCAA